jgi:hypothetical protein
MTKTILKTIVIGALIGTTAFFVPKMLLGGLSFFAIMCLFHFCAHRHHYERLLYMVDKIRLMTEEEYKEFKASMDGGCCSSNYRHDLHCGCKSKNKCDCKSKKKKQQSN